MQMFPNKQSQLYWVVFMADYIGIYNTIYQAVNSENTLVTSSWWVFFQLWPLHSSSHPQDILKVQKNIT